MTTPLRSLSAEHKVLLTCLLLLCSVTWAIGELLVLRDYQMADGQPGLSIQDMQLRFTGGYKSLLEARVQGDMRPYLQSAGEAATILSWVRSGADKETYDKEVAVLLEERCSRCHRGTGDASFRPLQSYAEAKGAALAPPAPALTKQIKVTKVHVIGIGLMLGLAGLLFCAAPVARSVKVLTISLGFLGLLLDFAGWWLMRVDLNFAFARAVGNPLMSAAFFGMETVVMTELWLRRSKGAVDVDEE